MKNELNHQEIYFTPKEAADHFNLSLSTVKNYIYTGRLKTLRTPGGHHRIRKSELLAVLGEMDVSSVKEDSSPLLKICCSALANVFKTLGPVGNSLLIHSQNVSRISYKLSKSLGLTEKEALRAEMAGLVHDIGHLGTERRLLLKSEPFTSEEYNSIKNHPNKGESMLSSVNELNGIADIVGQHHERIDGRGYPKGLSGKDIRKCSRIISIAEAYDAMISPYSYKKPIPKDAAVAELMHERGAQFDGEIVEIFVGSI